MGGVGERGALRCLDQDHHEALVLFGDEGSGDVGVLPVRSEEADEEEQKHDPANAEHAMNGAGVAAAEGFNAAFGEVEDGVLLLLAAQQKSGQRR